MFQRILNRIWCLSLIIVPVSLMTDTFAISQAHATELDLQNLQTIDNLQFVEDSSQYLIEEKIAVKETGKEKEKGEEKQGGDEKIVVPNKKREVITHSVELIKEFEGFSAHRYWDYKRYSIGYGLSANGRYTISKKEAEKELTKQVEGLLNTLEEKYNVTEDTNIQMALVSFSYNLGWRDEVIQLAQKGNKEALANQMVKYVKANNRILPGLVKRRAREVEMFLQK